MDKLDRHQQYLRLKLLLAMLATLSLGAVYYIVFRGFAASIFAPFSSAGFPFTNDPTLGSFPSFIHTAALTFLAISITLNNVRYAWLLMGVVLASAGVAEVALGHFSFVDLLASGLGACVALSIAWALQARTAKVQRFVATKSKLLAACWIVCCSGFLTTASYPYSGLDGPVGEGGATSPSTPVYLSYDDLRSAVKVEQAREIESLGRLYLYADYVFLNKRNEGIHIIDNTDPSNPVNAGFISIPGNTEISIRSDFLYADSYIDLVTIDLRDPTAIAEINRQQDVFPWDEYQNVPNSIWFDYLQIEPSRGVVIGYE